MHVWNLEELHLFLIMSKSLLCLLVLDDRELDACFICKLADHAIQHYNSNHQVRTCAPTANSKATISTEIDCLHLVKLARQFQIDCIAYL